MQWTPVSFLLALIAGLLVAGLVAWVRQARLEVLVPRLFPHSFLSDRGHLAELTVFNRGFKTEETIELSLTPSLTYEIVGASTQDITLSKNKVSIQRIGPGDEVSMLLLVEGGGFSTNDITNCLSKESKGRIVTKLADVTPTGPQRVALVVSLVIVLVGSYFAFDVLTSPASRESLAGVATTSRRPNVDVKGWTIDAIYANEPLFKNLSDGDIQISIGRLDRKGDIATVPIIFINKTSKIVMFSIDMKTSASRGKIPSYDQSIHDMWLSPGRMSEKSIKVIVPAKTTDPSEKIIVIGGFLKSTDGSTLKLDRLHQVLD